MMVRFSVLAPITFAVSLSLGGCAASDGPLRAGGWQTVGTAILRDAGGATVGTAELRHGGGAWQLAIGLSGQTPGLHGLHLHQVGLCDGPDFASAKGHLNPAARQHGSANPAGMHMGDIPNVEVGASGTASVLVPLSDQIDPAHVFDADGTSIVVHAGADDYKTDPSGNSGARTACGVLRPA